MKLFYEKPAHKWEETLPIGNGSLGAMIWGDAKCEHLGLNHDTLWSGYKRDKNNHDAFKYLEESRRLIENGKNFEAQKLIEKNMLGEFNESYLPMGDLYFNFLGESRVSNYERELDIANSVASVRYTIGADIYTREYIASYPAKRIFVKLFCTSPSLNFDVAFDSKLKHEIKCSDNKIKIMGKCPEHIDPVYIGKNKEPIIQGVKGMEFKCMLDILECTGDISCDNDKIMIRNAEYVVLAFGAVELPELDVNKSYEEYKKEHIKDYKAIYDKVELYLGEQSNLPTDERLKNVCDGKRDNALFALYFQYGRYLLISSSRKGSQPANLQGIWSWELRAPWSSNWTTNINTEMNYWLAQSCNLQECIEPYFELLRRLCVEGKKTAKVHYDCRGFVHHHNADYWCNANPVGVAYGHSEGELGSPSYAFWPMGAAWLCQELFKHYEYNLDKEFLQDTAYPILKEAALFLSDWLYEYNGEYVACPSTSPENVFYTEDGKESSVAMSSAMDLALIREVFGSFKKTCDILNIEDEILDDISVKLSKLAPFKIGSYGQLLEWDKEYEEYEKGHRHISPLYGLFPSEEFAGNDEMIDACKKLLEHRLSHGGGHTGWSCAWILNVFTILGDKEMSYKYLLKLLTDSTYDNLWDAHPPFQIDGNFGGTAGIANMLVQDRNGELKILPALPKEFRDGYVKGLRIKSGKTIDISWKDGELEDYKVY